MRPSKWWRVKKMKKKGRKTVFNESVHHPKAGEINCCGGISSAPAREIAGWFCVKLLWTLSQTSGRLSKSWASHTGRERERERERERAETRLNKNLFRRGTTSHTVISQQQQKVKHKFTICKISLAEQLCSWIMRKLHLRSILRERAKKDI